MKLLSLALIALSLVVFFPNLNAQAGGKKDNPPAHGNDLGSGNSGNGNGNTGPGNQGNDKDVGNACGLPGGCMDPGDDTDDGDDGDDDNDNQDNNGNGEPPAHGQDPGSGNSGNGVGNTGPGNQGNDKDSGNACGFGPECGGDDDDDDGDSGDDDDGDSGDDDDGDSGDDDGDSGDDDGDSGDDDDGDSGDDDDGDSGDDDGDSGDDDDGDSGDDDDDGDSGDDGDDGDSGDDDDDGDSGDDDDDGDSGDDGDDGDSGDDGDDGDSGDDDDDGDSGDDDDDGDSGDDDDDGDSGDDDGDDGDSGDDDDGDSGDDDDGDSGDDDDGDSDDDDGDDGDSDDDDDGDSDDDDDGDSGDDDDDEDEDSDDDADDEDEDSEDDADDEDSEDSTSNKKKKKNKLVMDAHLLPYLDLDLAKKAVNLDLNDENQIGLVDHSKRGYLLQRRGFIEGGVGAAARLHYENATGLREDINMVFGLLPVKGSKFVRQFWAPELNEENKRSFESVPQTADEVLNWAAGDVLHYKAYGGLALFAGVGGPTPLAVGVFYREQQEWVVNIVKEEGSLVRLSIQDGNSVSQGKYLRLGVLPFFSSSNEAERKGYSFVLDLSLEKEAQAFERLLDGDLVPAQKLNLELGEVEAFSYLESQHSLRTKGIRIGLPILFKWSKFRSKGQLLKAETHLDSGERAQFDVYLDQKGTATQGVMSRHKNQKHTVFSAAYSKQSKSGEYKDFGSELKSRWSYENENSTAWELKKAISRMEEKSGLKWPLPVLVNGRRGEFIGYTKAVIDVGLNDSALVSLDQDISKGAYLSKISQRAKKYLKKAFKDRSFVRKKCRKHSGSSRSKINKERCYKRLWTKIQKKVKSSKEQFISSQNLQLKKEELLKARAKFVRSFSDSIFVWKAFVKEYRSSLDVNYSLKGERVRLYQGQ